MSRSTHLSTHLFHGATKISLSRGDHVHKDGSPYKSTSITVHHEDGYKTELIIFGDNPEITYPDVEIPEAPDWLKRQAD